MQQFLSNIPEVVFMEGDVRLVTAAEPEEINPNTKYSGDVKYVLIGGKEGQQIKVENLQGQGSAAQAESQLEGKWV